VGAIRYERCFLAIYVSDALGLKRFIMFSIFSSSGRLKMDLAALKFFRIRKFEFFGFVRDLSSQKMKMSTRLFAITCIRFQISRRLKRTGTDLFNIGLGLSDINVPYIHVIPPGKQVYRSCTLCVYT